MHGSGAQPVATSSPPVFRPHLVEPGMSASNEPSNERLASEQLANLATALRGSLSIADQIAHEARIIRLVATLLRDERAGDTPTSAWLPVLGIEGPEAAILSTRIPDLQALIEQTDQEIAHLCDQLKICPSSKRKLLRSTERIHRLVKSKSDPSEDLYTITDEQLAWSLPSPTEPHSRAVVSPISRSTTTSPIHEQDSRTVSPAGMARVAFIAPSSSRSTGGGGGVPTPVSFLPSSSGLSGDICHSGSTAASSSSSLCPPSPLNLVPGGAPSSSSSMGMVGVAGSPALGGVPKGRARVVQSTSMQFGASGSRSPKPTRFHHEIPHVWIRRSTFRFTDQPCFLCRRPLGFGFLSTWEKCKSCKLKVHTHCKSRVGDTCGLSADHLRAVMDDIVMQSNSDAWGIGPQSANIMASRSLNEPAFQYPDNPAVIDSSSSTNSSAPSTPAMANGTAPSPYAVCRSAIVGGASERGKFFTFPDCVPEVPDIVLHDAATDDSPTGSGTNEVEVARGGVPSVALTGSQDSETATIRTGDGGGSDSTNLAVDSQGSGGDGGSITSELSPGGHTWDRTKWNMSTIRGASGQGGWSDVTIPFTKIEFARKNLIGKGRFGHVLRGYHFGDVAVKFLNMDHVEGDDKLEHFKNEVASFKNTRHDNIVLCLGYCLDHNKLGIVMGLCKGRTLFSMLHEPLDDKKVDFATAVQYALQICQGVSYLHQKKIIHRDLRTKNIFIENKNKAVITDLALLSMKRLRFPERTNCIIIPSHWLAYLAPELMRELSGDFRELPFTEQTDVFAFGTIWYELLTSSMPWAHRQPQEVIYAVGRGVGAPLGNLPAMREVKDILTRAWSFSPTDRPAFLTLGTLLQALPKKRLDRSPSHPMVRSYESIW